MRHVQMISASYLGEFFRLAILNCQSDSISLILDLPTKFFKHLLKKLSTPPFKNFKLRCTLHQWNANVCSTVWWVLAIIYPYNNYICYNYNNYVYYILYYITLSYIITITKIRQTTFASPRNGCCALFQSTHSPK